MVAAPGHGRRATQIMRLSTRYAAGAAGLIAVAAMLSACGSSGSSGTAPVAKASGAGCAPVAGAGLMVLTDDKHLQLSDDLVPAINKKAASPALINALNKVSTALDTPKLIALNKSVDVDRQTPLAAATTFAQANNLTAGIAKGSGGNIIVGAANFSENQEIAELYKIVLTAAGYSVKTQTIGSRELYEPQLEQNKIQVVPEYAATLTDFLNNRQNGAKAAEAASGDITTTMAKLTEFGAKANLVFGQPSTAADENAFAVTKATAAKYNLTTLSSFAAKCSGKATILAGPAECPQRPFCEIGLTKTYGITFGQFKSMGTDAGGPVTKKALTDGDATIGLVFSSDSAFAQ
jgi:osmoprotectant transport system substrate-binding protein